MLHTDNMTGTSTSTPTTVARAAPEPGPNKRDCSRDRKFKEVTRTDERSWRGNGVFNAQQVSSTRTSAWN